MIENQFFQIIQVLARKASDIKWQLMTPHYGPESSLYPTILESHYTVLITLHLLT